MSVRCECGAERRMSEAAALEFKALGACDGARPWLGPFTKEACTERNRLLLRHASNAYFSQVMSVISLPEPDEARRLAVDQVWANFLEYVETIEDLREEKRRKPPVRAALGDLPDEEVFAEIRLRKGGGEREIKHVKTAEIETLMSSDLEIGVDKPSGNFYARALPAERWASPLMAGVERVVLVHRLREVTAQVGFTRFETVTTDVEGELEIGVRRADLARELQWLPAVENRGEGIFLGFRKEAVAAWLLRPQVKLRGDELVAGFNRWKKEHGDAKRDFFGLAYVMLHTLSHLLITEVALDCGYPASSIRERVYARAGFGILLHTGSPDAEGTLGGLVEVGRRIGQHLEAALRRAELCSNDPVCAQHDPASAHERRGLLGAACHGCLLIAEPSCEQRNDFLDRALVVATVDNRGAEFFGADAR